MKNRKPRKVRTGSKSPYQVRKFDIKKVRTRLKKKVGKHLSD